MRLAAFIRQNLGPVIKEWIAFAETRTPASDGMTPLALRDHIEEILLFIADDLESSQTKAEQVAKSRGLGPDESGMKQSAAEIHASLRLSDGFDIDQMVSEYRALRASVVKHWTSQRRQLALTDLDDLTRFNEAIDQAMTESVAHYTNEIERSRNLFLGVLGHDLRNPIGAATMIAQQMVRSGELGPKLHNYAAQIVGTTERATQIVNDLLDITRSAFGSEIPVAKQMMDMRALASSLVDEMRALSDGRPIVLELTGDTMGEWDGARLGQVLSNVIGNALHHSSADTPVRVSIAGNDADVEITVRNDGDPIPEQKLRNLFDATQPSMQGPSAGSTHLGLGLMIASKIVSAHNGTIEVSSTTATGTTFAITLPRA